IDGLVRYERGAIDLRRHAAFAHDDVAAGQLEPAIEPLGEAERGGRGDSADIVGAVGLDRGSRRAVKIGAAELLARGRHAGAVLDGVLVNALTAGEDAP